MADGSVRRSTKEAKLQAPLPLPPSDPTVSFAAPLHSLQNTVPILSSTVGLGLERSSNHLQDILQNLGASGKVDYTRAS